MKKEELERFLGHQICFTYSGPDLPNGEIGPTKVSGTLIEVGIAKFKIEFNNGETHELTNEFVEM